MEVKKTITNPDIQEHRKKESFLTDQNNFFTFRHQTSELERQLIEHNAALTQSPGSVKKSLSPYFIEISEFLQFEIHR